MDSMPDIIKLPRQQRNDFIFFFFSVKLHNNDGELVIIPCICLYEIETGIGVGYPGYERWYLNLNKSYKADATMAYRANAIRTFLNYMLWETECDSLCDITLRDIQHFVSAYRYKDSGETRNPTEWNKGIGIVYDFLNAFYVYNSSNYGIAYNPLDFITVEAMKKEGSKRTFIARSHNSLGVKPPPTQEKRQRFIPYNYLDLILAECKRHDPMIMLGVALQAYGGLRED